MPATVVVGVGTGSGAGVRTGAASGTRAPSRKSRSMANGTTDVCRSVVFVTRPNTLPPLSTGTA